MPRHLISDAHEWINEIPTVPIYYLAKPQPRERTWEDQRGKKTLLSLTLVSYCEGHLWRRIRGRLTPPVKYPYGDRSSAYSVRRGTAVCSAVFSTQSPGVSFPARSALRTLRGGEFDWGGTSVK
jgi:hypothetical protein